ncbi:MAG TPA: iron-containing alcohol dehydrogenase [bacterium]|nr:iron-containing alcohol dehydrogenase [bacterium]
MMNDHPEVTEAMKKKAMRPSLEFGRGIIREMSAQWGECLVITQPPVWEAAQKMMVNKPAAVHFVKSMDRPVAEAAEKKLPPAEIIVGIGGGMALDMAKYVAGKRGTAPVLVPGIASVDACVTNTIAVRDDNRVRYIGFVIPRAVVSDFTLMRKAPKHLNRAGVGDLLSIHTALFDWKLAAEAGEVEFDQGTADHARELVDVVEEAALDIRDVTDDALEFIIKAYAAENALCLREGHSRPEEGSEHFFAYNVEHRTARSFVHGELVCLGVLIMARLQENQPGRIAGIFRNTGVRFHPRDLGLSRREIEQALLTLGDYVGSEGLFHTIINEAPPGPENMKTLLSGLKF